MTEKFLKTIKGEGFNEIVVDIGFKEDEIGLHCTDSCLDGGYVTFDIEKAKELMEAINSAIMEIRKRENENVL